jgi:hypothetical protein
VELQDAVNIARRGGAVAFLGAGFSLGAKNKTGAPIPSSADLKNILAGPISADPNTEAAVLADLYTDQLGETSLRRTIIESFSTQEVGIQHRQILSHPWRRIYTTNYDDVCELAADEVGRPLVSVTLSDAPDAQPSGSLLLVHLHGSIRSYSQNQGSQIDFQLSASSYLSSRFPGSPWAPTLRSDIRFARAVFFIGYSLSDFDIARLLYDEDQLPSGEMGVRDKVHIIRKSDTPEIEKKRLSKFGSVWPTDIAAFAALLSERDAGEPEPLPPVFVAFRPYSASAVLKQPTQDDYVDFLTKGTFRPDVYEFARSDGTYYATPRHELAALRKRDPLRRILVHAGLGNGKTLFLEELRQDLLA